MAGLSRKHKEIMKVKEYGWRVEDPIFPSLDGCRGEQGTSFHLPYGWGAGEGR
jgi:hypothetical protein